MLTLVFGQGAGKVSFFEELVAKFSNLLGNCERDFRVLDVVIIIVWEVLVAIRIGGLCGEPRVVWCKNTTVLYLDCLYRNITGGGRGVFHLPDFQWNQLRCAKHGVKRD